MKTTLYWTMQHTRRALHEFRFRATCWWLSQQVEFLGWRLRLKAQIPPAQSNSTPGSIGQDGRYAMHPL